MGTISEAIMVSPPFHLSSVVSDFVVSATSTEQGMDRGIAARRQLATDAKYALVF